MGFLKIHLSSIKEFLLSDHRGGWSVVRGWHGLGLVGIESVEESLLLVGSSVDHII